VSDDVDQDTDTEPEADIIDINARPTPPEWAPECRNGHCTNLAVYRDRDGGGWYETRGGLCSPCGAVRQAERDREVVEGLLTALRLPQKLQGLSLSRTIEPNADERRLFAQEQTRAGAMRAMRDRARETSATTVTAPTVHTVEQLRAWRPPGSVFLHGTVGSGKTHLAAALLQDHVRRTVRAGLFVSEADLARNVRRRAAGRDEPDLTLDAERASVLLLDDLATSEGAKVWQRDQIEDLICYRYNAGTPTLITSNVPLDGIGKVYGARVESRIREMAEGNVIAVSGLDWRA
jgi:DNA replication protein DnaC